MSSGGDQKPRQNLFEAKGTRSVRSDVSEEKLKEKQDEVTKTIKEKEFLQKRTHELLSAMQAKNGKKSEFPLSKNFVISEIRSDVDSQTHVSDNSQQTQSSQFTSNSNPQSNISGIFRGVQKSQNMVRSASNQ